MKILHNSETEQKGNIIFSKEFGFWFVTFKLFKLWYHFLWYKLTEMGELHAFTLLTAFFFN